MHIISSFIFLFLIFAYTKLQHAVGATYPAAMCKGWT